MFNAARFLLLAASLFLAGLLDAGASISKTRVGKFLTPAPVVASEESSQVLDTPLENWTLYDGTVSGRPFGFVDGPNLYAYVQQNPWTTFDPEGLASLKNTRKDGQVTIAESQDLQLTDKEATAVLKQYNAPVVTPKDVSDKIPQGMMQDLNPLSRINDLRREFPGMSDSEVFAASSAKSNAARARYELVKNEGSQRDSQNIQLSLAMGSLTMEMAMIPFSGLRAPVSAFEATASRMTTAGIVDQSNAILKSPQFAKMKSAFEAGEGMTARIGGKNIQLVPNGPFSGFTNFRGNGFALGKEAFSSKTELQKTVLHEMYRLSTSSTRGGAIWGEAASQETRAAAAFAERYGN